MIPLQEFRKSLGSKVNEFTEQQILKLRDDMDTMAGILFKMWLKDRNEKRSEAPISQASKEKSNML